MPDFPLHLLAGLASRDEQVRHMTNGSAAEYLDPDDLLNDAFHFCERMRGAALWTGLSELERAAVVQFEAALRARGDCVDRYEHSTIGALVGQDRDWAVLRQGAGDMFRILGATPPA